MIDDKMKLQTDDYSCGPIALQNAYYYLNGNYPKVTIKKLCERCSTTYEFGTWRWDLHKNGLMHLHKGVYNVEKIMKMKAFILLYSFGEKYAHYVFVENRGNSYMVYNYCDMEQDYTHILMNRSKFRNILRGNPRVNDLDYPIAWEV